MALFAGTLQVRQFVGIRISTGVHHGVLFSFGTTAQERADLDETAQNYYETTMSEWLAVEAIVRQRDKEKTAHAVAKLSSSGSGDKTKGVDVDAEMENEVNIFFEVEAIYSSNSSDLLG